MTGTYISRLWTSGGSVEVKLFDTDSGKWGEGIAHLAKHRTRSGQLPTPDTYYLLRHDSPPKSSLAGIDDGDLIYVVEVTDDHVVYAQFTEEGAMVTSDTRTTFAALDEDSLIPLAPDTGAATLHEILREEADVEF